ncbi:MAG: hypothetical protein R2877_06415 [Bdellovibrionota bacterium]
MTSVGVEYSQNINEITPKFLVMKKSVVFDNGRFTHLFDEPNTDAKRAMVLEYYKLSLKDLNGKIKSKKPSTKG